MPGAFDIITPQRIRHFMSRPRMSQVVDAIKSWLPAGIMRGDLTSAIQNLATDHGSKVG